MFGFLLALNSLAFIGSQVARIKLQSGVAFTLLDLTVSITVGFWLIKKLINKDKIEGFLLQPLCIFILVCALSLIANSWVYLPSQIGVASLYLFRFITYFGLYLVIRELGSKKKEIIKNSMLLVGSITVLIGFAQYIFYPDLEVLYFLGWDEHLYRMYSTFLDPNYFGSFLIIFFLFVCQNYKDLIVKRKAKIIGLLLVIVFATVLTYSRSAIIMGVSSIGFYYLLSKNFIKMVLITLLFLSSVFLLSNYKIEGLNPFRIASTQARVESAQNAIEIIKDHPILGVGFNTYRYTQDNYGFRNTSLFSTSHADAGTDNSFLFILATTGVIGFVAYIFLLKRIFSMKKFVKGNEKNIFLTMIFTLLVGSLFNNLLFYTPIMAWIWINLGLMENK